MANFQRKVSSVPRVRSKKKRVREMEARLRKEKRALAAIRKDEGKKLSRKIAKANKRKGK